MEAEKVLEGTILKPCMSHVQHIVLGTVINICIQQFCTGHRYLSDLSKIVLH